LKSKYFILLQEFSSDSATDAYLVRSLCHQHKSFTGRYLMTKVKQHLSTKCSEYEGISH